MPDVITGPGWYKTRDGRKVEIVYISNRGMEFPCFGHIGNANGMLTWRKDGSYSSGVHSSDIIAPWTEPEEARCVAIYRIDGRLIPAIIEPDDSPVSGEVGRAIVKLKGGA